MTAPIEHIRHAYFALEDEVTTALHTQVGDSSRLNIQRNRVLNFMAVAQRVSYSPYNNMQVSQNTHKHQQHQALFPPEEYATLQDSVNIMVEALEAACNQLTDPMETTPLIVAQAVRTGKRGRPRIEIDSAFLEEALALRKLTGVASAIKINNTAISARTVKRRALEHGLVEPGTAPFSVLQDPDGSVTRVHNPTSAATSNLTDEELDTILVSILEVFPLFGRRMIMGRLKAMGHQVTRQRVCDSYVRVHGIPAGVFGDRAIHRRSYHVAGANSLWHHDGQHGKCNFSDSRFQS
jgi:hypothetical protein